MKIPGYLDFHTEWATKGDSVNSPRRCSACYGDYFPRFQGRQSYDIWAFKYEEERFDVNNGRLRTRNLCFLSLEEMAEHMYDLERMFPPDILESWSIEEEETKSRRLQESDLYKAYHIKVTINGGNIFHRFALTWIRTSYEFPYSVVILDVKRIRKMGGVYSHLNPMNLFTLCGAMYTDYSDFYWRSDQSMGHKTRFLTLSDIHDMKGEYLSDVFGPGNDSRLKILCDSKLMETDYWLSEEEWKSRFENFHVPNLKEFLARFPEEDKSILNEIENYSNYEFKKKVESTRSRIWDRILRFFV